MIKCGGHMVSGISSDINNAYEIFYETFHSTFLFGDGLYVVVLIFALARSIRLVQQKKEMRKWGRSVLDGTNTSRFSFACDSLDAEWRRYCMADGMVTAEIILCVIVSAGAIYLIIT